VRATRRGERVEFERGSFTEVYALEPDSVEQTFVFESRPGHGDLVLRIPVATDLCAVETAAGLEFHSGRGHVAYSRAVAIDARGRRTPAATHFEDGAITIRVEAGVLADAAFPLVIDPVLNQIFPDTDPADAFAADSAYDPVDGVWVVVYEQVFSAADHDVYAMMYGATGTFIAQASVDVSGDSWVTPRIADLASAQKFLVVGGSTAASNGAKTVRGRVLDPNGALLITDPQVSLSAGLTGNCILPDVGGDPSTTSGTWCVVFQRDFTIIRCLVSSTGAIVQGPNTLPTVSGSSDANPSISKSNGGSAWLVTWKRSFSLSHSIQASRISPTGVLLNAPFPVASGTLISDPRASSPIDGTNLSAITYQGGTPAGSQDSTIVVALLDGGTVLQLANLMTLENSTTAGEDQIDPDIDSDGRHFLVSYSEWVSAQFQYEVFVSDLAVSANTLQVAQSHVAFPFVALDGLRSSVAAARAPGTLSRRYLVAYDHLTVDAPPLYHEITGTFFDGIAGGPTSTYCFGDGTGTACPCGNSGASGRGCANSFSAGGAGLEVHSGNASTLADTLVLRATGVPIGATGLFFQGTTAGAGTAFGDGLLCAGGTIVRLAVKTAIGSPIVTYPAPGDAPLTVAGGLTVDGGLRTYQFWYRDSASYCTSAVFNLTNGLGIQWAR
jgi:hypothetical protein